jgi:hypothetical protein
MQPSPAQIEQLLTTLQIRFETNMTRHSGLHWQAIQARLQANPIRLQALYQMEATGGEPDVIGSDPQTGEYLFVDCSTESPSGRRSLCYDRAALDARKEAKPANSALDLATEIGIDLLTADQYHALQQLGAFDTRTSSWLATPDRIRERGGAIFGDRRYDTVFVYHNGAESYYAARGFRGILRV